MFEVQGGDIGNLTDTDLRTLVARLAIAELSSQGLPSSGVTAGGNQDAVDGGIDVRVTVSSIPNGDFVPRGSTGFQVKRPDMPPGAIKTEMRPKGKIRDSIAQLAAEGGAYIIVSAQGSLADKSLTQRKKAMLEALRNLPDRDKLHLEFYDRERLAIWVNIYPAIVAWVRERSGRPLSGWSSIGKWANAKVGGNDSFLSDASACLLDEQSCEPEKLTLSEGVSRMRTILDKGGKCIRLIGLSGVGKTRLVEALFETEVAGEALDPGLAVYTDYSDRTEPTAREMARQLVQIGKRAILVVDNCNPTTHAELTRICSQDCSAASLITIEYDVGSDEPEQTQVFRMGAASGTLLFSWIAKEFPYISQVDLNRIVEFSDGNFRVARALAETLAKGETLGLTKNKDLIARIFEQRKSPDSKLLKFAERLSLFYSFDGTDTRPQGELAIIGEMSDTTVQELFAAVATLRNRKIIQSRGRWRALLPQAIANYLASAALEQISPADFDELCQSLPLRMLRSLSRRLGYLHQSPEARELLNRWLRRESPMRDRFTHDLEGLLVLVNLAPIFPKAVLVWIQKELEIDNQRFSQTIAMRTEVVALVRKLAYEPVMFETAAKILQRFVDRADPDHHSDTGSKLFAGLFHINLSGTKATPGQRRDLTRRLLLSKQPSDVYCGTLSLKALLKSGYFSSSQSFEFGARPRDWGWHPDTYKQIDEWFNEAIQIAIDVRNEVPAVSTVLANSIRPLWGRPGCRDHIETAVNSWSKDKPWIEGWLALRATLSCDGEKMSEKLRERLAGLVDRNKPTDLLDRTRAIIIKLETGGWDFAAGEQEGEDGVRAWRKAVEQARLIGEALAQDHFTRSQIMPDILRSSSTEGVIACGQGLAAGADDLSEIWKEASDAYGALNLRDRKNYLLRGLIIGAAEKDKELAETLMDFAVGNPQLTADISTFQSAIGADMRGINRLRQGLSSGVLAPATFFQLATGAVEDSPATELAALLNELSYVQGGTGPSIEILAMRYYCDLCNHREPSATLIRCGRGILRRMDFSNPGHYTAYNLCEILKTCISGKKGGRTAKLFCRHLREAIAQHIVSVHDIGTVINVLLQMHPSIALSALLLAKQHSIRKFFTHDFSLGTPTDKIDHGSVARWADEDKTVRYPLLGDCLSLIEGRHEVNAGKLSPLFLFLLERAPAKYGFLGEFWNRIYPTSYGPSLADALISRRDQLKPLECHSSGEVRQWLIELDLQLVEWIQDARSRDRRPEESFE